VEIDAIRSARVKRAGGVVGGLGLHRPRSRLAGLLEAKNTGAAGSLAFSRPRTLVQRSGSAKQLPPAPDAPGMAALGRLVGPTWRPLILQHAPTAAHTPAHTLGAYRQSRARTRNDKTCQLHHAS
jgi:hypothetical protein